MVGGDVKEVIWLPDAIWVNVKDRAYTDECAIYVERNPTSERIKPGDVIWWQGRSAMWTPFENLTLLSDHQRQGTHWDIVIPRIGYSGAYHPGQGLINRAFGGQC